MPSSRLERVAFAFLTVLVTVPLFAAYNTALAAGEVSNAILLHAWREVPIEFTLAFALEVLVIGAAAERIAFRLVDPSREAPYLVVLAITGSTIFLMCPAMSLAATFLHDGFGPELISGWLRRIVFNLPFAFFSQVFLVGPLVRFVFGLLPRGAVGEEAPSPTLD